MLCIFVKLFEPLNAPSGISTSGWECLACVISGLSWDENKTRMNDPSKNGLMPQILIHGKNSCEKNESNIKAQFKRTTHVPPKLYSGWMSCFTVVRSALTCCHKATAFTSVFWFRVTIINSLLINLECFRIFYSVFRFIQRLRPLLGCHALINRSKQA